MAIENGDEVTFEYVARKSDGTVFDTSRRDVAAEEGLTDEQSKGYTPLTVTVGTGELIEGLDEGLLGLEEGDLETFTIPPEKGYGEWTNERIVEYSEGVFRGMLEGAEPEVGTYVQLEEAREGKIVEIEDGTVQIDFNHHLADETLEFEIEILEISD